MDYENQHPKTALASDEIIEIVTAWTDFSYIAEKETTNGNRILFWDAGEDVEFSCHRHMNLEELIHLLFNRIRKQSYESGRISMQRDIQKALGLHNYGPF